MSKLTHWLIITLVISVELNIYFWSESHNQSKRLMEALSDNAVQTRIYLDRGREDMQRIFSEPLSLFSLSLISRDLQTTGALLESRSRLDGTNQSTWRYLNYSFQDCSFRIARVINEVSTTSSLTTEQSEQLQKIQGLIAEVSNTFWLANPENGTIPESAVEDARKAADAYGRK
ncbi:hypothetical protein GJ688_09715 [Heliobacillus mobilis]|uniref:Uncharacterized protein n=1 Tax=Heliobacterium mobile TaxID=28064 RepID=A0A6I3SK08_HELMO|nr:hypothetical protein [Heliobacterium mobile]MTV49254.1 hypothetical protein [Heliobacterium mobile]